MRDFAPMDSMNKKVPFYSVLPSNLCQIFSTISIAFKKHYNYLLDENAKKSDSSKMFMFLPSTLDLKEKIIQYNDKVNLHPVDVDYDHLKEFNQENEFNPSDLDNKDLRKDLTKRFYNYMKAMAEISNINLIRNSHAYISSGGKTDPDQEFYWIDNSQIELENKF